MRDHQHVEKFPGWQDPSSLAVHDYQHPQFHSNLGQSSSHQQQPPPSHPTRLNNQFTLGPCPWPIHGQQPQFYSNLLQQSSSYQQQPRPIHPNSQFTLGPWPVPGQNDVVYGLKFPISSAYANRIWKNREIVKKAREDDQNEKNSKFAVTRRNKNSSKIFLRPAASNHRRARSQRTATTGRKIAAEGAQLNSLQKRVKLETIDEAETSRRKHSHYIESPSNLFTFEDTKPNDLNYGNSGSNSLLAYSQFPQHEINHQIKPEQSYVVQRPPSNAWHFDSGTVTNLYSPSMPKQTFYHGSYQVPMMTKLPSSYEAYQVSTMATAVAPKYAGNNTAVNSPLMTAQNASTYNNRAPEFYHSQPPLLIATNTHSQQTEQIQSYGQQRHTSATTKSAEKSEAIGEDESWRSYLNLD